VEFDASFVLLGEVPDDVDVVAFGGAAALAFGGVFAGVVEPGVGDLASLQRCAGPPVELADGVVRIVVALNGPTGGVDDHEQLPVFMLDLVAELEEGAGAFTGIKGGQGGEEGVV